LIIYYEWFNSTSDAAAIFSQGHRSQNTFEMIMQSDEIDSDPEADAMLMRFGEEDRLEDESMNLLKSLSSPAKARKRSRNPNSSGQKPKSAKEEKFGKLEKYLEIIHTTPRRQISKQSVFPLEDGSKMTKSRTPRMGAMRSRRPKSVPNPDTEIIILDENTPETERIVDFVDLSGHEPMNSALNDSDNLSTSKYTINLFDQLEIGPDYLPTPSITSITDTNMTPTSASSKVHQVSPQSPFIVRHPKISSHTDVVGNSTPVQSISNPSSKTVSIEKPMQSVATISIFPASPTPLKPSNQNHTPGNEETNNVKDRIQSILSKLKTPLAKVSKKESTTLLSEIEIHKKIQSIVNTTISKKKQI
jgi:hypothetical protein